MQDAFYRTPSERTAGKLSAEHYRVLTLGSRIDPEVIAERGVRTVRKGRGQLPSVYSRRQKRRGSGILFDVHRPDGQTATIFRPDEVDPEKPGHKYEQECKHRGGSGNVLDIHSSVRHLLEDKSVPAVFVEGIKKGDSITSAARREGTQILPVSVSGVWNFLSEGEAISDMYLVPVAERRVYVAYDSDLWRKPEVMLAAERLAEHLKGRGASVWIVCLEDQPDGSKSGADDYFAGGGSLGDLLSLARPYSPGDLQSERLSRSEGLRGALDELTRRESEMPATSMRECSARATFRAYLTAARKRGKLTKNGVEVAGLSARTGAELAAMSQPTFSKRTQDLVEAGYLRRIKRERSEQADSYVLLVPDPWGGGVARYQNGEREQRNSNTSSNTSEVSHGDNATPPLPEMRWSSPGRKGRRGVIEDTRRVRQGRSLSEDEPSVRRPGKKRREIVAYVVEHGGSATREELLEAFGGPRTQWRDFKRQTLADLLGRRRQYKGEDLSVGPPIIELTDDGIRLLEGWREALEEHRELGGEEDAAIRQKVAHLRQRAAYRRRNDTKADRAPTEEEMAQRRGEGQKRRKAARLVYQGMAPHIVAEELLAADGFICELEKLPRRRSYPEGPPMSSLEPEVHPLACACLDCAARMPRYAVPMSSLGRGG
jgi:Domain of unknown function (DUF3854)